MDSKTLRTEYEKKRPLYCSLVQEVQFALEGRIERQQIKVAGVIGRAKAMESLIQKAERKNYNNPLDEIDDLAGVRVICLYEADLDDVQEVVEQLFTITESIDKTGGLGLDRMGYHGRHYVVLLSSSVKGPRYDHLRDLRCEIQLRTVLQDAWAQLSHHLVYKSESSIPSGVHRQLNNVSSLLEIAQSVFDNIRQIQSAYVKEIDQKKEDEKEFLTQPINSETLTAYTEWKYPNRRINGWIQEMLIRDLDHDRFRTLGDLDLAVDAASNAVECYRKENPEWFKSGTDFLTKSLGFYDDKFRNTHAFAEKTRKAFWKYADKVQKAGKDA